MKKIFELFPKIFLFEKSFPRERLVQKFFWKNVFWLKHLSVEIYFGRKVFINAKSFSRKQFGWKKIGSKIFYCCKIIFSESAEMKIFFCKLFLSKNFLVENFFVAKSIPRKEFGWNIFWENCFWSKFFYCCKLISSETFWMNKIFCSKLLLVEIVLLLQNHLRENILDK